MPSSTAKNYMKSYCQEGHGVGSQIPALDQTSIFDKDGNRHRRINVVKHSIFTGEARPIRLAPGSLPLANHEAVSQIMK